MYYNINISNTTIQIGGFKMKVLVLSNGKLEEMEIGNTLEDLQKIVGGYIEIPYLGEAFAENEIDVIINEEGKFIDGLKPEIAIVDRRNGQVIDIVYGNCIFASHDYDGNTIGLNDAQMDIVINELKKSVELMNKNSYKTFEVKVLFM